MQRDRIAADDGEVAPVCAERDGDDPAVVFELRQQPPAGRFPDPDESIRAGRRDTLTIVAERDHIDAAEVCHPRDLLSWIRGLPDAGGVVLAARRDVMAIRTE